MNFNQKLADSGKVFEIVLAQGLIWIDEPHQKIFKTFERNEVMTVIFDILRKSADIQKNDETKPKQNVSDK